MKTRSETEAKILAFSRQLAEELGEISWEEYGSPFAAIEARVAEIGDQIGQEMAAHLSRIENETAPADDQCRCPQCDHPGKLKRLRQRELQTTRGTTELTEPEYHCKKCRRSFFPSDEMDRC